MATPNTGLSVFSSMQFYGLIISHPQGTAISAGLPQSPGPQGAPPAKTAIRSIAQIKMKYGLGLLINQPL
jgi:hypothetical protein